MAWRRPAPSRTRPTRSQEIPHRVADRGRLRRPLAGRQREARGHRPGRDSTSRRCRSSPTRAPKTSASSSELLASRLAPCTPVDATSPQAHRPGSVVRPQRVHGDAAHVVVRRRRHRHQLDARVDARRAGRSRRRSGSAPGSARRPRRGRRGRPGGRRRAGARCARATTSRGASSASGCSASMKRSPRSSTSSRAFAAQRLGEQRQRVGVDGERGRMELHELEVDQRARRRARRARGRRRSPRAGWWCGGRAGRGRRWRARRAAPRAGRCGAPVGRLRRRRRRRRRPSGDHQLGRRRCPRRR